MNRIQLGPLFSAEEQGQYLLVRVKNMSIQIKADDEGVVVDIYPLFNAEEPIATTYAHYTEAEEDEDGTTA